MTGLLNDLRSVSRCLLLTLLLGLTASPLLARDESKGAELRLGLLAHSYGPVSAGIESGADLNLELLLAPNPRRHPLWGRLLFGANLNLQGATGQVYVGRGWQLTLPWSFEAEYQLSGALHNGELNGNNPERRQLGSRVLLRNAFELGWRWEGYRLSVIYDHASTADLIGTRNQGLDNVGLRLSVGLMERFGN